MRKDINMKKLFLVMVILKKKKKSICFKEGSKTVDGGNKLKRRSERIKQKTMSAERFVRRIRPSGPMTWGPFTYIVGKDGYGSWYGLWGHIVIVGLE